MALMKIYQIRELPEEDLKKRIQEEEENLAHLKFQKATSQLENPMKIRNTRKTIARLQTTLKQLELKIQVAKKEPKAHE